MRRLLPVLALLLLGACAATTPMARPSDGFAALRFKLPFTMPVLAGGVLEFAPGTMLVADRARDEDGQPVYCGTVVRNDFGIRQIFPMCLLWQDGTLTAHADIPGGPRPQARVPSDAFEEIRLR